MNIIFLSMLFISTSTFLYVSCSTTIRTSSGTIKGTVQTYNNISVKAYLGIPFAQPPVRKLRFLKPVPIEPWNHTWSAETLPPGCPQVRMDPKVPGNEKNPKLSIDCLYLNIWVPPASAEKKAVMFFLHSGGFAFGSSRLDFYNGRALAAEGDVIVVTTHYRLGIEGFFNSHSKDAPGNMGLYDMVESLKWIRHNIKHFGGDKNLITVFGTSAGAISTGMLTVSPFARGLFKRAIMQSGSPTHLDGEDKNNDFKTSKKVSEAVGCINRNTTLEENPLAVVKCMKEKNPFKLAQELLKAASTRYRPIDPPFDSEFLPQHPRDALIKGDFEPVDLMIGVHDGEGSHIITSKFTEEFGLFGEKSSKVNLTFGEKILRTYFRDSPIQDNIVEHYLGKIKEEDDDEVLSQVIDAVGDYSRICPSVYFAESFAKKTTNVYFYFLTHILSNTPFAPWMKAVHFDEVPLVFGYPLRYPEKYSLSDQNLSRTMIQGWSSFAKTGHPDGLSWPRYSEENPHVQILDARDIGTEYGPHRINCDFFRETFGF